MRSLGCRISSMSVVDAFGKLHICKVNIFGIRSLARPNSNLPPESKDKEKSHYVKLDGVKLSQCIFIGLCKISVEHSAQPYAMYQR